jgi:hypothetical protein
MGEPQYWGAARSSIGAVPGGRVYRVGINGGMRGVGGITWRQAAIYCNWLTNGKSLDRAAFLSGAYDVSTFGYIGNIFTDQTQRSPGAKYFIPTLDEWMKAAHYDPHRYGPNQEGWWHYSHTSDTYAIPGPPGQITPGGPTQANYGNYDPFGNVSLYPLGSYPTVMSPWGLLDTAGVTAEWNEEVFTSSADGVKYRGNDGSNWFTGVAFSDQVWSLSAALPNDNYYAYGFRIAAVVPTPCAFVIIGVGGIPIFSKRRR